MSCRDCNDTLKFIIIIRQIYSTKSCFICQNGTKPVDFDTLQMINIILNGENTEINANTNIEQLLQILGMENKRLAVELNQEIIPRSNFRNHTLNESDKVEIVQAIGGG